MTNKDKKKIENQPKNHGKMEKELTELKLRLERYLDEQIEAKRCSENQVDVEYFGGKILAYSICINELDAIIRRIKF